MPLKGGRELKVIYDEKDYKKVKLILTNSTGTVIETIDIPTEDYLKSVKLIEYSYNRCKEEMEG